MERVEILRDLRLGEFDVLVGVNLLREGLDLPEVSLVAIIDADKEGFLRNERSLTQTAGRAARNVNGKVIFYADVVTDSMQRTIDETNRRRAVQIAYNEEHDITPIGLAKTREQIMERSTILDIRGKQSRQIHRRAGRDRPRRRPDTGYDELRTDRAGHAGGGAEDEESG